MVKSWTKRASVTAKFVAWDTIGCASGSAAGFVLGLSCVFDTAGLGSSLGAGDGRTLCASLERTCVSNPYCRATNSIGEAYSACTDGVELKLCFRARGRAIGFEDVPLIQDGCPRFPRKAVTVALEVAICLPWVRGSRCPPLGCVGMILSTQTSTRKGACKMSRLAMDLVRQVTACFLVGLMNRQG